MDRVDEALQYHMNTAATASSLRNVILECDASMLAFLEKPDIDHCRFISTLGTFTLPTNASWYRQNLADIVDKEAVLTELESELGLVLKDTERVVEKVADAYNESVKTLFELDSALHTKIVKINDLGARLSNVIEDGDRSVEASALQASIESYIKKTYERNNIEEDYKAFCKSYARFCILHPVIKSLQITPGSGICSICTEEKVNTALVPCGHAFCGACASKQRSQCYICRCTVNDRLKLYFV